MKRRITIPSFLYLSIWALNTIQGALIDSSFLSLSLSIPFLLLSLYYIFLGITRFYNSNPYLKGLSLFFIILFIYGIIRLVFGGDLRAGAAISKRYTFLWSIVLSLGPIFAAFILTIRGYLTQRHLEIWGVVFLLIHILKYYLSYQAFLVEGLSDSDYTTINEGYGIVGILPLLFCYSNKRFQQYLMLGVCMALIVFSAKRGAILASFLFLFWFFTGMIKSSRRSKRFMVYFAIGISLVFLYLFFSYLFENNDYFLLKYQGTFEGDSSGRDRIYGYFLSYLRKDASFPQLVLGSGADATLKIAGIKAHQDWLELAVNCGLIGITVYLYYWICALRELNRAKPYFLYRQIFGACIIITFVISLYSMSYDGIEFATAIGLGYSVGQIRQLSKYESYS